MQQTVTKPATQVAIPNILVSTSPKHDKNVLKHPVIKKDSNENAVVLAAKQIRDVLGDSNLRHIRRPNGSSYFKCDDWIVEVLVSDKVNRTALESHWSCAANLTNRMRAENPSKDISVVPALFYKQAHAPWRVIWPLHLAAAQLQGFTCPTLNKTVEGSPDAWGQIVRLSLSELVSPISRIHRVALTNEFFHYA